MKQNNSDHLLRELARQYAEQYGGLLQNERALLNQHSADPATPRLDKQIAQLTKPKHKKRGIVTYIVSAAAACLVLAFLLPMVVGNKNTGSDSAAPSDNAAPNTTQEPPTGESEQLILPLTFTLPGNLTVADVQYDNGKSVYSLSNTLLDDIVLVLETALEAETPDYDALTPITVNGEQAYAQSTADYKYITFEKDGVRYTMTCKYELDTLVDLSETIL